MQFFKNSFAAIFPACCIALVFTVAPIDSTYTAGMIGAKPVCAQDSGVDSCLEAWETITAVVDLFCPAGTRAHCDISCGLDGDVGQVNCICVQ